MTGIVTDIQRFSLNDGPGIRTSVFLKGCNLSCTWCHNPETIAMEPEELRYPEKCIGCHHCVDGCVTGARVISGRRMDVGEVMAEIVQDKAYYDGSGGGVTLTGGEVFCQADFALAVADACGAAGIAAAIETNLSFPWEHMAPLIDASALVMCDCKLYDDGRHRACTGAGNARILENIRRLDASGKPWILRTPLIPGATDDDDNIAAIAAFARTLHPLRWELLNFNPLGASKYTAMGRKNPHAGASPLDAARLEALAKIAASSGAEVKLA